jgi:hypothetical protein
VLNVRSTARGRNLRAFSTSAAISTSCCGTAGWSPMRAPARGLDAPHLEFHAFPHNVDDVPPRVRWRAGSGWSSSSKGGRRRRMGSPERVPFLLSPGPARPCWFLWRRRSPSQHVAWRRTAARSTRGRHGPPACAADLGPRVSRRSGTASGSDRARDRRYEAERARWRSVSASTVPRRGDHNKWRTSGLGWHPLNLASAEQEPSTFFNRRPARPTARARPGELLVTPSTPSPDRWSQAAWRVKATRSRPPSASGADPHVNSPPRVAVDAGCGTAKWPPSARPWIPRGRRGREPSSGRARAARPPGSASCGRRAGDALHAAAAPTRHLLGVIEHDGPPAALREATASSDWRRARAERPPTTWPAAWCEPPHDAGDRTAPPAGVNRLHWSGSRRTSCAGTLRTPADQARAIKRLPPATNVSALGRPPGHHVQPAGPGDGRRLFRLPGWKVRWRAASYVAPWLVCGEITYVARDVTAARPTSCRQND